MSVKYCSCSCMYLCFDSVVMWCYFTALYQQILLGPVQKITDEYLLSRKSHYGHDHWLFHTLTRHGPDTYLVLTQQGLADHIWTTSCGCLGPRVHATWREMMSVKSSVSGTFSFWPNLNKVTIMYRSTSVLYSRVTAVSNNCKINGRSCLRSFIFADNASRVKGLLHRVGKDEISVVDKAPMSWICTSAFIVSCVCLAPPKLYDVTVGLHFITAEWSVIQTEINSQWGDGFLHADHTGLCPVSLWPSVPEI